MVIDTADRRRAITADGALLAQIYDNAPMSVRAQLVEQLLAPMSVYALISVAGGVFAQIKGRNAEWQGFRVGVKDIEAIRACDVAALAQRVLPAHGAAIERLEELIAASGARPPVAPVGRLPGPPNEKPSTTAGLTHEYVAR